MPSLNDLANLYSTFGRFDEAMELLRRASSTSNAATLFHNLGRTLDARGDYYLAIEAYQQALRRNPDSAISHAWLAQCLCGLGRYEEAAIAVRKATGLDCNNAQAYAFAAVIIQKQGRLGEATELMKTARELATGISEEKEYTSALLQLQGLNERAPKLSDLLAGTCTPATGDEKVWFAYVALYKSELAIAVRLFDGALGPTSELTDQAKHFHYAHAARAAARTVEKMPAHRALALRWLREDLKGHTLTIDAKKTEGLNQARAELRRWQQDQSFSNVRDPTSLQSMPAEERAAWTQFWAEVQTQVDRTKKR